MKTLILEGKLRNEVGKKSARQLRREGEVPCNLYGGKENIHFSAPYNSFLKLVYNPDFFKVQVHIDGRQYDTLIKEIQFHPVTDRILHVDFIELVPGKKVKAEIPLKLTGLAQGVKDGGKLIQKLRKLKVKALPEHLTEAVEINVESLQLGKSIYVRDINNLQGIEILNSPEVPVATVTVPRSAREEAKPQAAAAAGTKAAADNKKEETKQEAKK